jgi:hypothetical protein
MKSSKSASRSRINLQSMRASHLGWLTVPGLMKLFSLLFFEFLIVLRHESFCLDFSKYASLPDIVELL